MNTAIEGNFTEACNQNTVKFYWTYSSIGV